MPKSKDELISELEGVVDVLSSDMITAMEIKNEKKKLKAQIKDLKAEKTHLKEMVKSLKATKERLEIERYAKARNADNPRHGEDVVRQYQVIVEELDQKIKDIAEAVKGLESQFLQP